MNTFRILALSLILCCSASVESAPETVPIEQSTSRFVDRQTLASWLQRAKVTAEAENRNSEVMYERWRDSIQSTNSLVGRYYNSVMSLSTTPLAYDNNVINNKKSAKATIVNVGWYSKSRERVIDSGRATSKNVGLKAKNKSQQNLKLIDWLRKAQEHAHGNVHIEQNLSDNLLRRFSRNVTE